MNTPFAGLALHAVGPPALTLPFCFATLSFVLIKGATPKLDPVEVEDITTPEEHLGRTRGRHSAGIGRDPVPGVSRDRAHRIPPPRRA